jgi:hypothetical protein
MPKTRWSRSEPCTDVDTCTVGGNLAALLKMKKFQEAEILRLDVLRVLRRMLGRKHPETMRHENTLAVILSKQGKCDEGAMAQRKQLEGPASGPAGGQLNLRASRPRATEPKPSSFGSGQAEWQPEARLPGGSIQTRPLTLAEALSQ